MRQPPALTTFHWTPSLAPGDVTRRLHLLMQPGTLTDTGLEHRAGRLERLFVSCASHCPVPLWGPGLVIHREWRTVMDTFLPWCDIAPTFRALLNRALNYRPPVDPWEEYLTWPDVLDRFARVTTGSNPALLVRRLLADGTLRRDFLFSLFLPSRHGESFGRYRRQSAIIGSWLATARRRIPHGITCLDAACGTGEGVWDLAGLCRQAGFPPEGVTIHGTSRDPLELFAGAHGCFPHDTHRERRYREQIRPLIAEGWTRSVTFTADDLTAPRDNPHRYDLIICNGLLGGPLLHTREQLIHAMGALTGLLKPGGLFLAADRFHEGWKRRVPPALLNDLLREHGMTVLECGEGIAGEGR